MRIYGDNVDDVIDDSDDISYNNREYYGKPTYYDSINNLTLEEISKDTDIFDQKKYNNSQIYGGFTKISSIGNNLLLRSNFKRDGNSTFDNINDLINYQREKYTRDTSDSTFTKSDINRFNKKNIFNVYGGAPPVATIRLPGNLVNVGDEYMSMRPVDYIIQRIKSIKDNQTFPNILIVKAGTGTGKSFVLPVDIYTAFNGPNIICVQPTVILTTKLAKDVYYNNNSIFRMGKTIGYLTSSQKVGAKGLLYVTTGILVLILRRLVHNLDHNITDANDPQFILVDEAHRRPLEMEVSLVLLNELIIRGHKRAPFIILLSATLNIEALCSYFKINVKDHLIEVSGSTSVRVDTFIDNDSDNIIYDVVDRIKKICDKEYDKILEDAVKKNNDKKTNIRDVTKKGGRSADGEIEDNAEDEELSTGNTYSIMGGSKNKYNNLSKISHEYTIYGCYDGIYDLMDNSKDPFKKGGKLVHIDVEVGPTEEEKHELKVNNESGEYETMIMDNSLHIVNDTGFNTNYSVLGGDNKSRDEKVRDTRKVVYSQNSTPVIPNDILVFVPTNGYINRLHSMLLKWILLDDLPIVLIGLTSKSFAENAEDVMWLERNINNFMISGKRIERRIILATNVAETGVTFTMLKHIIETGIVNSVEYNPHFGAYCSMLKPTSKDSIQQRIGRVGRIMPGVSHGMYSKDTFNLLKTYNDPDIVKEDFSLEYLLIKESNINYRDLIDKPMTEMVYHVEDKLFCLGFINNDNSLTDLGKYACKFSTIPIESIKMILCGFAFDICISDLITIAAVIQEISLPTFIPICDQFITALIFFEVALFNDPRGFSDTGMSQSGVDISFLKSLNLTSKLTETNISKILSTRWDIVKSLSTLGFSLYNVPSHITDLCKFVKEYKLIESMSNDIVLDNKSIINHPIFKVICNFKRCIYEGYKLKTIFRHNNNYVTLKGDEIMLPNLYTNIDKKVYNDLGVYSYEMPNVVVAHRFDMMFNNKTNSYELKADCVSILDGFIGYDLSFYSMYTRNAKRALTDSEFNLYQESLPIGSLIYSNTYTSSNKLGGKSNYSNYMSNINNIYGGDEDAHIDGYLDLDKDIDL